MGVSLTELGKSNHHKHLLYSRFPNDNSAKLQSKRLKIFLLSGNFLTIQPGFATDPANRVCGFRPYGEGAVRMVQMAGDCG